MKLFIDTWGWLALHDRRDKRHAEAVEFYHWFRQQRGLAYTSDYVLDETITLLYRRLPIPLAAEALNIVLQAADSGYLQLERIDVARFAEVLEMRRKFNDKPLISFTDLSSMVVMKSCGITEILTEDDHFLQVGMGFRNVP